MNVVDGILKNSVVENLRFSESDPDLRVASEFLEIPFRFPKWKTIYATR